MRWPFSVAVPCSMQLFVALMNAIRDSSFVLDLCEFNLNYQHQTIAHLLVQVFLPVKIGGWTYLV